MDLFERTYWSVYFDFLDDFRELKYKGYSIPHLFFFLALFTRETAKDKLIIQTANYKTRNKVTTQVEVQQRFDLLKRSFKSPHYGKKKGKILFHDGGGLLRFPPETWTRTFHAKNSIIMKERTNKKKNNRRKKRAIVIGDVKIHKTKTYKPKKVTIPEPSHFQYYDMYSVNNKKEIVRLQEQAKGIIDRFQHHPMYVRKDFEKHLLLQIAKAVNRIEQVKRIFERVQVSCVVVPYQQLLEVRVLALIAAQHGIPTICVQHGIVSGKAGFLPKLVDIEGVYGQFEVQFFKNSGIKEEEIKIIGHPRFDQLFSPPTLSKTKFDEKLGINPSKKNILIIVRKELKEWGRFIKSLNLQSATNIIVRDFPDHHPHLLTKSYSYTFSSKGCPLYDLIHYADVVVSYHSTVALEAMIAGKPVFILSEKFHGYSGYFDGLGELIQQNPYTLAALVQNYMKSSSYKVTVKNKMNAFLATTYPNRYYSEERLAQLIKTLSK